MIGDILKVGDEVILKIPEENREWGYNPAPDGTHATIESFDEIDYSRTQSYGREPGIYVNKQWCNLRLEDGESLHIGAFCLAFEDLEEYDRRLNAGHAAGGMDQEHERLRDLPETPYWEGDRVEIISDSRQMIVDRIDYMHIGSTRNDGSPWPIYELTEGPGYGTLIGINVDNIRLVERGNIWKYYNNEPIVFSDLMEEATFARTLGLYDDVRNPSTLMYTWTKDEALDAIRDGIAHSISVDSGFFGSGPHTRVCKFRDEDLGRRVAAATLDGFK